MMVVAVEAKTKAAQEGKAVIRLQALARGVAARVTVGIVVQQKHKAAIRLECAKVRLESFTRARVETVNLRGPRVARENAPIAEATT